MRRSAISLSLLFITTLLLSGCSPLGDKAASISIVYGITAGLALLLLALYCCVSKKVNIWYLLLFASVFVVNTGYWALSISRDLNQALMFNRLAYLGSVFLPLSMWMIIIKATHVHYAKWLPGLLLALAVVVFLIAASPGYLPIYYQDVTFERINGVSTLVKVYGPLHVIYLVYLLGYFVAMVISIIHATATKKLDSIVHTVILAMAVFVNIGVWMIEQLVQIDFEVLSVSYIISESFLLGLNLLIAESQKQYAQLSQQENGRHPEAAPASTRSIDTGSACVSADPEQLKLFLAGRTKLTPKEQQLYDCYVAGMLTSQIMEQLNIKENTLKFHNKNLYGKLGISSRKQLVSLHRFCVLNEK